MTSLALMPSLKRTITDVMDEDLYHLPNSPIQGNQSSQGGQSSQFIQQQQGQRGDYPHFKSFSGSPVLSSSQLVNNGNVANKANLSSLLNIPDSFIDQYTKNNISSSQLAINTDFTMNEDYYNNQIKKESFNVNPFNDYGNPDTQINSYIIPQEVSFQGSQVQGFGRSGRIKTLDTVDEAGKNLKDEDYLLFNPDIQPSELISQKGIYEDYTDSSLFVPSEPQNRDNKIAGYENDYLMMDHFDEEVEDDLSEDDDNYFYDDEVDFDDMIMSGNGLNMDDYTNDMNDRKSREDLVGGFLDSYYSTPEQQTGRNDESTNIEASMDIEGDEDDEEYPLSPSSYEDESDSPASKNKATHQDSHGHRSAAEISASNPNHQCDLVNPSTGQPCFKQFSRPYDLIRHQETIHASKKKVFRCVICEGRLHGGSGNGKSKTFSRGDALSRHIKVKHGLVGQDALDLINEAKVNVEYVSA